MGLLNDVRISRLARAGMIRPFVDHQVSIIEPTCDIALPHRVMSYGLSSYGYDIRVGSEFKVYTNLWPGVIDPKDAYSVQFHEYNVEDFIVIPPNSFALAHSIETFAIPRNVMTLCIGKSSYARCGIIVNVTAFEPEWCGQVTIEISNTTPLPSKIYANEGIAQVIFFEAWEVCEISYADRKGKYQGQFGITLPR
jgi:dCTP deaminase